ncbi:uncharacterized protein LOC116417277 [Nasonia vitripennis]|uniref:Reverse transcriptase domain-containing protein n=1 Tax=Nasonia vitripennis TaxID=7425 RepID=A0A7M7QCW6_NASVI|nr:uncharacterized protein LOC116417277 [Nasonia vitripennis]
MVTLPRDWAMMSLDDKLASVFNLVGTVRSTTDILVTKVDALAVKVDDQGKRIELLEFENDSLRSEVASLKERYSRGTAKPELKVVGIPASCQLPPSQITEHLFVKLGLTPADLNDIFDLGNYNIGRDQGRPKILATNRFSHSYSSIVLAGDLNSNLLVDDYYSSNLKRLVFEQSMHIVPFGATHHCENSHSWLDTFIVDSLDRVITFEKSLAPFINGHDSLFIEYEFDTPKKRDLEIVSRDFRKFSPKQFASELLASLTIPEAAHADVNEALDLFQSTSVKLFDLYAPFTTRKVLKQPSPWITKNIKDKCKKRDHEFKRAVRSGDSRVFRHYRKLDSNVKSEIKEARDSYIIQNCSDVSKTWSILRKFGLVGNVLKSPLHFFSKDELIDYYSSVTTIHPPCSIDTLRVITDSVDLEVGKFELSLLQPLEVYQAMLKCLSKSKSRSCDGLSLTYFETVLADITPFLTDLFNRSITSGIYPELWKKSQIVPLSKVASPKSTTETRPVANLAHFAKVFDSLITQQTIAYLENESIISPRQSGFRADHSTETALLRIVEDIRRGADRGLMTLLLLFDFRRAFDSINHVLLLQTMRDINLSANAITWFHSYITGHSQAVVDLDGTTSAFKMNTSGVPQGSSPGPIIFLIFINLITLVLRHCNSTCMLFADDLQIYIQCHPSDFESTVCKLNEDANAVVSWSRDKGLMLNIAKTKAILLGSVQHHMRLKKDLIPPIVVDGCVIPLSDTVKNLGVYFSTTLTWNAHISQLS